MQNLESKWKDASSMQYMLKTRIKPDSHILAEEGGATILALYDTVPPSQVTTLDWFEYAGLTGDEAYLQAIRDGYFDYIELDGQAEAQEKLADKIREIMSPQYNIVYNEHPFEIYELEQ